MNIYEIDFSYCSVASITFHFNVYINARSIKEAVNKFWMMNCYDDEENHLEIHARFSKIRDRISIENVKKVADVSEIISEIANISEMTCVPDAWMR